jgi:hypothetical protein
VAYKAMKPIRPLRPTRPMILTMRPMGYLTIDNQLAELEKLDEANKAV